MSYHTTPCRPRMTNHFCADLLWQVAAAWCLLVQDLLMWQDWSPQLLAMPSFKEEWSGGARGSGQLLFRGPRIRCVHCLFDLFDLVHWRF